jgi:ABC-type phosphate/phosphonate transport system substrate-binding protein
MRPATYSRGPLLLATVVPVLIATVGLAKPRPPVRMALSIRNISWVEPVSAKAVAATVMEEIGRKTGYTFLLDIYQTADEQMVGKLISGDYNVGITGALEYVQISPRVKVKPLSREFRFGKPSFKILLLVRKDSNLKKIGDLKGKKLSLSEDDPINKVYLRVLLARNGIKKMDGFFSAVEVRTKPKAAVLDLFMQEADVCLATDILFNSMAQLNPQLKRSLRAIHYSEAISTGAIFARADTPAKVVKDFKRVLLTLHETEKGKQLLRIFRTPKVVAVSDSDFESARKIWNEYQALTQQQK